MPRTEVWLGLSWLLFDSKWLVDGVIWQRSQHERVFVNAHAACVDCDMATAIPNPSGIRSFGLARWPYVNAGSSMHLPLGVPNLGLQEILDWGAVDEKLT